MSHPTWKYARARFSDLKRAISQVDRKTDSPHDMLGTHTHLNVSSALFDQLSHVSVFERVEETKRKEKRKRS